MSTLTKVLIVLLTAFSLVLCGIVVTYVTHADNQKAKAEGFQRTVRSAQDKQKASEQDLAAAKDEAQKKEAELNAKISDLTAKNADLSDQVSKFERLKTAAEDDQKKQAAAAELANKTLAENTELFRGTQDRVKTLEADQINLKKDLDELNVALMGKMADLAQLEEKNKQLAEANQELSNRLNQYLLTYGKMAAAPKLATPSTGTVLPQTTMPVRDISLSGKVANVDMQNNVAQISLGSANGVRKGMIFHVTRGDQFICDIVISDVDPDTSVGQLKVLDPSRAQPRVGDAVSTNI